MPAKDITQLLADWRGGDDKALQRLLPLVYDDLRRQARRIFRGERKDHTLQPTAVVHETYVRLLRQREVHWQNRAHFYAVAAHLMRRLLVDHARARAAAKRGRGGEVSLAEPESARPRGVDVLALDAALARLAELDPGQARIVELRFFGGLTVEEAAEALGISPATIKREWSMAKVWLYRALGGNTG